MSNAWALALLRARTGTFTPSDALIAAIYGRSDVKRSRPSDDVELMPAFPLARLRFSPDGDDVAYVGLFEMTEDREQPGTFYLWRGDNDATPLLMLSSDRIVRFPNTPRLDNIFPLSQLIVEHKSERGASISYRAFAIGVRRGPAFDEASFSKSTATYVPSTSLWSAVGYRVVEVRTDPSQPNELAYIAVNPAVRNMRIGSAATLMASRAFARNGVIDVNARSGKTGFFRQLGFVTLVEGNLEYGPARLRNSSVRDEDVTLVVANRPLQSRLDQLVDTFEALATNERRGIPRDRVEETVRVLHEMARIHEAMREIGFLSTTVSYENYQFLRDVTVSEISTKLNVDRGKSLFKREFAANIVAQLRNDVRLFDTYDREQAPQPLLMFQ